MTGKREFGDYQTPQEFSDRICQFLIEERRIKPRVVIEPTCGLGNFLDSSLKFKAELYFGIELQQDYYEFCKKRFVQENIQILQGDIFDFPLKELSGEQDVLLIGNPPWVTSSTLSSLDSNNLPSKTNIKFLKGMDALTGASNFDICEYIILQLIDEYKKTNAVLAMLCKTNVARNVFQELHRRKINFEYLDTIQFNSKQIFDINASACLMVMKLSEQDYLPQTSNVFEFKGKSVEPIGKYGFHDGKFYSNLELEYDFDGESQFEWRQGVKHDNSKVMELNVSHGKMINGLKETVELENELVFPLIKSSMLKKPIIVESSKKVIVTQKKVKEETTYIKNDFPKTWDYLDRHRDSFEKRKSSIYNNAPAFSMFGIGDYSYSSYKVGISGFYKKPLFPLMHSENKKPVMMDDTGYFLSFDDYDIAYAVMLILNSEPVQEFLMTIAFLDAKRPFTKKVLQRLDFRKIIAYLTVEDLVQTEMNLGLKRYITDEIYRNFNDYLIGKQLSLF